jgi:hypothetical protein
MKWLLAFLKGEMDEASVAPDCCAMRFGGDAGSGALDSIRFRNGTSAATLWSGSLYAIVFGPAASLLAIPTGLVD